MTSKELETLHQYLFEIHLTGIFIMLFKLVRKLQKTIQLVSFSSFPTHFLITSSFQVLDISNKLTQSNVPQLKKRIQAITLNALINQQHHLIQQNCNFQ